MNTISFMSANFVAREVGYQMTGGWMEGHTATYNAFAPLETFQERFDGMLAEVQAMGFQAIDIWISHLHYDWATAEHLAIAKGLLAERELTVVSYAGGYGNSRESVEAACRVATELGTDILGGNAQLLSSDRALCIDILQNHGVRLGIENHPEKSATELLDKIGDGAGGVIGAAVDTGWFGTHAYNAALALEELQDHLIHVHLKDVLTPGEHETCRFGEGCVPIEACVHTLRKMDYLGAVCVEHEPELYDPTEDCIYGLNKLEGWLSA